MRIQALLNPSLAIQDGLFWGCYRIGWEQGGALIILAFLKSLRIFLIKKVTSLIISTKMATPGFLKRTVF